jgi:hypothetical protein
MTHAPETLPIGQIGDSLAVKNGAAWDNEPLLVGSAI